MDFLKLLSRNARLFDVDISQNEGELSELVSGSKFLVIGAAGSIGQAVVKEIFKRNPIVLHAIDLSENNLVELVRDLRSSLGYIDGDFRTFAIDVGSKIFEKFFFNEGPYDYVLNLSALKHVRSEKDPYTLLRMIEVNVFNTTRIAELCMANNVRKYFCVSTDKAANPVNLMGASKRVMELFLFKTSNNLNISTARFANVAFSDGSLPHGFGQRLIKNQPLSAPDDVKRYFVTPQESGQLCLMSCLLGGNGDIFFPKLNEDLHSLRFSEIATRFLIENGYEPYICATEEEARNSVLRLRESKKWPVYFFKSDTSGEKDYEEFYTATETLDLSRFVGIGIVLNGFSGETERLTKFQAEFMKLLERERYEKEEMVELFSHTLNAFDHIEREKNLDQKM